MIKKQLSEKFIKFKDYFVVDSMLLEVAKISRNSRIKICKEHFYTSPNRGFCASQNRSYYGYKRYLLFLQSKAPFKSFDMSKASVHDIDYLEDIKHTHN